MPSHSKLIQEYSRIQPDKKAEFLVNWRDSDLKIINSLTNRNVISYYSNWSHPKASIDRSDINAFMSTIHNIDCSKGLDLILHTPGGDVNATERIIHYLHSKFGNNIRAIIPQDAMSGGTMIALSCKSIIMGNHSCLGPVDPFHNGLSVFSVIKDFQDAKKEILENPKSANYWIPILNKYPPTILDSCLKAKELSEEIVINNLSNNMFAKSKIKTQKIQKVIQYLVNPDVTKTHGRPIHKEQAKEIGLKVESLESNQQLQEAVLTYHHKALILFQSANTTVKLVENHLGNRYFTNVSL